MALFKRAQVSVLLNEPDRAVQIDLARRRADATTRPLIASEKLVQNIKAFADAVQKAKPAGAKGTFINRVAVSSSMGPGVKVEPASLFPQAQS